MNSFSLTFHFYSIGPVTIGKNQCWLARVNDNNLVNSFFDWLEAKKYHREAKIEYVTDQTSGSDIYAVSKFFRTLRYRFPEDESDRFYYQQRYNATENENVQTLRDYLGSITDPYFSKLAGQFGLDKILDEKINMLSTGEFRKAVTFKTSMAKPAVLFIDEPCTGLDTIGCRLFNRLFAHLVRNGTSVVIFTSAGRQPDFITNILKIGNSENDAPPPDVSHFTIPDTCRDTDFKHAFELKNINAGYNGRDVLHDITWSVARDQKWSLTGHNGAGKSTLLSFVYADNPQVYCNDVRLFDNRRGSGESIWEIKDRIGFYSSELHRYFNKMQTVGMAINSIVFQNPYEKRVLTVAEEFFRLQLLNYFELDRSDDRLLCDLPAITQKLVILSAVLLKNAPLLILDEPFQGFSESLIQKCLVLIVEYVRNRTFIIVSHNFDEFPECINRHFHLENGTGKEVAQLQAVKAKVHPV